ncbi:LamG-like jellyroll fold domain-containing protein [Microbacterium sp. PA5]|uniref:LamG-like jellyroll fold domain-containing protein n=1 Tax=Microbacterium sp. PA5 TaxID=3416654 RepID=UPI003CF852B7
MRSRLFIGAAIVAVIAGGLTAVGPTDPASALSPGLSFSADDLPTWQTNAQVFGVAGSQGRVVAGGAFTELRPGAGQSGAVQSLTGVAILDAATGQPDACQLPATLASGTATVYAVAAAPDGNTVFVGGNFSRIGGVARSRLAEIDLRTCRVTSFNPAAISSTVLSLAVTADAVYIGGAFQTVGGQPRRSFAKLSRTGALDTAFVANAYGATTSSYSQTVEPNKNARGTAITLSPTGDRVVIGGDFFTVNGQTSHSFAVVSAATGANLRTWPASTVGNTSRTKALVSDGTRFYVGNEGFNGFDGSLAYNWSDYSQYWRDSCAGATQAMLLHEGILFEAHHHHDCSGQGMFPDGRRTYLSATRADDPGQLHLGWLPELNDGTGEALGPRAFAIGTAATGDEYLWVAGEFTRVNGEPQQGLTRFGSTDTGNPPTPTIAVRALTPGTVQVNIRGVVDPDDSDLTYAVYKGTNTTTPIWTGVAKSQHWYRNQVTFVDTNVTPGQTYSYRARVIDAAGNRSGITASASVTASGTGSAYASTVLADAPRLYWRYDDTAVAQWIVDSAGETVTGLNGLAQNGVDRTATGALAGDPSLSATFSETAGLPQYIWNDVIAQGPTTYSVETWLRTTSTTGGALVNYGSSNGRPRSDDGTDRVSSTVDRVLYMESGSGFVRFGVRNPNNSTTTLRSTRQLNDGQWHHVVATQSAAGMRLYIDGALQGQNTTTANGTYYGTWHAGGDNLIGYQNTASTQAGRYFHGQLDETAVYHSALPASRISAHYAAGTGTGGDTTPPAAPGSVTASVSGSTVDLSWNAAVDNVGVTSYEVHRGTTATFTPSAATLRGSATATTYADSSVPVGTWYYRVIAKDAAGNVSAPSVAATASVVPPDTTAPTAPTGVTAAVQNGDDVAVSWSASTDAVGVTGYEVHRGTTADFALSSETLVASDVTTTSFTQSDVAVGTWFYRVRARDAAGNWSPASDAASATIDPDTTAPTVPTGLSAVVQGGDDIALSWGASTDAGGVSGYAVHRGTTPDFSVDASSRVTTVGTPGYTDTSLAVGTWYYRVTAIDAAGNVSAPTAAVSATIAPATTTRTVVADADTMAAAVNPAFVYGTSTQLSSRFDTAIESFLRFPLPAAPAGMALTGATLSVRTSSDPTAGSADAHQLRIIDATWDEATLTWANRPTTGVVSSVLGELSGATAVSTAYTVDLQASQLADRAGTSVSLRLSSSAGTDNVRLWTREATNASFRPTLTLTYTAIP